MKILVLTHAYPRFRGDAAGNFIARLNDVLHERGVTCRVIAPASPGYPASDTYEDIPVSRFRYAQQRYETLAYTGTMAQQAMSPTGAGALASFIISNIRAARAAVREFEPDIIHAHWWFPSGIAAVAAAKGRSIPVVMTSHGSDVRLSVRHALGRRLGKSVLRRADAITTVSQYLANGIRSIVPTAEPVVAQMPVSVDDFEPGLEQRNPNRVLFVGRLNDQKGIESAIRALAAMQNTETTLDVVGNGPNYARMQQLTQQLDVSDRVVFHGHRPYEELPGFYQQASALIMPSIDEGLGLTAVESLLCETPVIGFDSGGIPDVVLHEQTGLLVPPRQIGALASAMDRFVAEPALARTLGRAGRKHVLATFSPSAAAERYIAIYNQVMRNAGT